MCRLLGCVSRTPTTLTGLLGEVALAQFTELSRQHGDGWGIACGAHDRVEVHRAVDAARTSDAFSQTVRQRPVELAMVHLRWATLGLPVALHNAHPFTDGRLAFAHNGSVAPPSSLDRLLSDRVRPALRGDTDSERLFLAVLSRLEPGADDDTVGQAYAETVREVAQTLAAGSLNSMLMTPTRLYAACCYDPAAERRESEPGYYRLGYRVTEDTVVVGSSGWGAGWQDLANGHLLAVDRGTLRVRVSPLGVSWPAREAQAVTPPSTMTVAPCM